MKLKTPSYYPAFINLCGKKCVIVGGGRVAERKALSLIRHGAKVRVISPFVTAFLERQKQKGNIRHINRSYKRGDLKGAFLVIAAASEEDVNRKVAADAPFLVNVVDRPDLANFIVPSVAGAGPLTIAVSTAGASPAMARAIRKEIETLYGKDFGGILKFLKTLRRKALREIKDGKARERFFKEAASKEIMNALRKDGIRAAKKKVVEKYKAVTERQGL
jgi:precorrin-2 dehydrogenase/sirohydrochlorin ferrochelatase